jgi:hypothetical protein
MRKASRARRPRKSPPEEKNPRLERLKEIAGSIGLEVREERLKREVGYSVRGGLCRVEDREMVLLDKLADPHSRIEILCNVLAERDLATVFVEPELRRLIGGRALERSEDWPDEPAVAQARPLEAGGPTAVAEDAADAGGVG